MQVIFLLEDDSDVRVVLRLLLESQIQGCTVQEAATGRAFFALLERQRPDLVLLDVQLPDVDGISVYHLMRLRPDLKEIPVLFVTANPHLVSEAALTGPYACLAKPFDMTKLVTQVQVMLGRGGASDVLGA